MVLIKNIYLAYSKEKLTQLIFLKMTFNHNGNLETILNMDILILALIEIIIK